MSLLMNMALSFNAFKLSCKIFDENIYTIEKYSHKKKVSPLPLLLCLP